MKFTVHNMRKDLMCEMRCLIFYQPLDRVLEGVRFLLELQLVKGGDAFLT